MGPSFVLLNERVVHGGQKRRVGPRRGDDDLAGNRVALLRHRAATATPSLRRLLSLPHFCLCQKNDILRHLREASRHQAEPTGEFYQSIALRVPWHHGQSQIEFLAERFHDRKSLVAERSQSPGSAAELNHEG